MYYPPAYTRKILALYTNDNIRKPLIFCFFKGESKGNIGENGLIGNEGESPI